MTSPPWAAVEARNAQLRSRIAALVTGARLDVLVTHIEVNDCHGVGFLARTLFGDGRDLVVIRSADHFLGEQAFGARAERIGHGARRASVYGEVCSRLSDLEPRRILATPYYADDVRTAVAVKDIFGAPLCTFLMDDQNVHADGIGDADMRELLVKSDLRLAISAELRDAYQAKYDLPFAFMPPVVRERLVLEAPAPPAAAEPGSGRRGVLVGNVWGRHWLDLLRTTVRRSGIALDWYCNGALVPGCTPEALALDGIHWRGAAPDDALVAALRASPFVVVPSGTMDEHDDRRFIAALSLPSRITYVAATSHTPMVVLGSPETAAARFVTRAGIGRSAPYDAPALAAAVAELSAPEAQVEARRRAAALAPRLSSRGALDWIWASLAQGRPVDDRFESLAFTDR